MDLICQWFQSNLDIVFFIYGLSFVVMGVAILTQPKKGSRFKLANILWLLAGYALIHAPADFMDMWVILKGRNETVYQLGQILTYTSYLFLFEFGRRLVGFYKKNVRWYFSPIIIIGIVIVSVLSDNFWVTANILVGYLIRLPAGVMSGLGLFLYYNLGKKEFEPLKVRKYFYWVGSSLLAWAFFCGIVRAKADFLPANWLNTETFYQTVKLPVYFFRTICALITTWGILGILRIFHWETIRQIQDALSMREVVTEGIEEGVSLIDRDFKILWANKREKKLHGEIVGDYCYHATHKRNEPCQPPDDICPIFEVLKAGKSSTQTHTHFDKDGNRIFVEVSAYPVKDIRGEVVQFIHVTKDITERKKREAELYRVNRTLKMLIGCNQRLIRATEKFTFVSEICQIIVGVGGYRLAWIGVAEQDEEKNVRAVAQAGFEAGYLETLNITWADTERGQEPVGTAIRTGKTCICRNILTDPKFAPWRDEAFKRGYASSIAFPIQFEDKVIGALNIYATATDAFNESEVELLTELSNDLAYGIVTLRARDEHKKAEEALRESENRYRLLADNVTDVIFITDLNLRFTYVSPSVIGMFGYSTEEVVAKRLEEFLTPSSVEVAKKALAEEMGIENNQGKGFFRSRVLELEIISKDGSSKWAEVKTTFLRDSDERPTSILGICRDLTERMEAEAALIQTNERLQYLLSSTSAVIYTSKISGDYGVTYITDNVRQITGYEPREFTENSSFWIEHVHPEDRPRILEELPRIFEQGFHIHEYRFLHKNGTYRWMRNEMRLEKDKEGKPLEIAGIWIDITERKLIEEKIRHAAEEWRTTFDSITDMVSIHDRNFKIIRVNKAYANFLKKRPQEVIGMTCYELFHGSKEHHPYCPHIQTIRTKKPTTVEFFDSYQGVYLEIFCSPIFDEKGEVIATVHIAKDITLRKEMERTQRLTQLGKLVADMAHEVNNPLMVISGRAQLSLMEQIQNEAIKNNLKIIFEECQRARDIIQRLLSFSRPSKGELKEININRSIETVIGVVEHQFKLAGIEIKRNYIEEPPAIVVDEKQIQEVVMNLLNNAKDAMPKVGVIEIVTSYENDFLRIDFKDTGSGISEEDIKRMFEPFFTTKKDGTGLGLSLCYGIVKAHGGDIKIESKFGKGTTVTVLLPVKEVLGNA